MRIYSRKRPECQEIEGAQDLCRLCLQLPEEPVPIFDENTDNICAAISLRIMICVGLEMEFPGNIDRMPGMSTTIYYNLPPQISREDCLSNVICLNCFNELNKYYTFRKRCEVSYQKLKSHIQAVKEKLFLYKELESRQHDQIGKETLDINKNTQDSMLLTLQTVQASDVSVNMHKMKNSDSIETEKSELKESLAQNDQNCEMWHQTEQPSNADISTFLSTILVQLGVLTHQDNNLVYLDPGVDTLQLVTGEDNMVTFHLEEEGVQGEDLEDSCDIKQFTTETPASDNVGHDDVTNDAPVSEINNVKQIKAKEMGEPKVEKRPGAGGVWCATCGKSFASRATLRRHARVHSGERPFVCATCARAFSQREVLARHALVHLETRPFKCSQCDKSFTQRAALGAHARSHSAPRALHLHRCALCPKVFLYPSGLSRHMTIHAGRVYVCGACGRHFKDKSSLLRHLQTTKHHAHSSSAAPATATATAPATTLATAPATATATTTASAPPPVLT